MSEESTMRLPSFTTSPPSSDGSTLDASVTVLPTDALRVFFELLDLSIRQRMRRRDLGQDLAASLRGQGAVGPHHVRHSKKPPVTGGELEEVQRKRADAGFPEYGNECAGLVVGSNDGAADKALEIRALVIELLEFCEIALDLGDRVLLLRKIKQGRRVPRCHTSQNWFVCRHVENLA